MIEFENELVNKWNKKIIYAPNGFGKTTNSLKLYNYYVENDTKPLLFTRRNIEKLVCSYGNSFFFGQTAENAEQNQKIAEEFYNLNPIKDFCKKNYNTYSMKQLKSKSFFFSVSENVKKLNEISSFSQILVKNHEEFLDEEVLKIDKLLDSEIYYKAKELLALKTPIKKVKIPKRYQIIDKIKFDYLKELREYLESIDANVCLLCGKRFKNKENLLLSVDKRMNKYRFIDENDNFSILHNICSKIKNLFYNTELKKYLYTFDEDELFTVKGMIHLIRNYVGLCESSIESISSLIGNINYNNKKIKDEIQKYVENEKKIYQEKNDVTSIASFNSFIIKEINNIISCDSNISFVPVIDKMEISVTVDGIQPEKNIYEFLSESEVKRFSLVVLRALIRYGRYECLILDDPIDSYDDYYMLVACDYIKNILFETKLKNWYILTNNFTALINFSNILKCESIIYYHNPDDIFTNSSPRILSFNLNFFEVEMASKNELSLLHKFLNGKLNIDSQLGFIALIVTLRNFKSLILANYDKVFVRKNKVRNQNAYFIDENFCYDLERIIEHYYMHYDECNDQHYMVNSNSISVNNIYELYNRIGSISNKDLNLFSLDFSPIVALREKVCKRSFNSFSGNKLLNLIFMKISIMSYLKFEFEKILIIKLKNRYSYIDDDIKIICDTKSLGKKVEKAKKINATKLYGAEKFLSDYKNVFDDNSRLFNLFDHALEQMFPPYIATNVKDIKRFKMQIDDLNSEYL